MRVRNFSIAALAAVYLLCSGHVLAQDDSPPWSMVSIYHVAPGKHMDFLKWMQQQEAIATEAGVEASKWYSHVDGANWDFVVISPITTEAQDKQIEKLTREKGLPTGFKAGLQFRVMMANHTDTMAVGPVSVDDLVKAGSE